MAIFNERFHVFLLLACVTPLCAPARRELRIPEINVSSPAEINNLNRNDVAGNKAAAGDNVEDTIKEVEDLIKADPTLPRLTRGEILDIIDNITKSDAQNLEKDVNVRDQKAIMVVMPYSPDNAQDGDVQALYTKPPVTHLIGEQQKKPEYIKRRRQPTKKPALNYVNYTTESVTVRNEIRDTKSNKELHTTEIPKTNPTVTTTYTPRVTKAPYRPLRRRTTTTKQPTTRFHNHKYPDEEVHTTHTTQKAITYSSTTRPSVVYKHSTTTTPFKPLKDIPTHQFAAVTTARPIRSTKTPVRDFGISIINPPKFHSKVEAPYKAPYKEPLKSEQSLYKPKPTTTPPIVMEDMQIPEDFKNVLKNLDILIKENPKYSSQYDELTPLKAMNGAITHENVHDILASIGAYTPTTTTTTLAPDIQQLANNLSPDMKDLLMNFGLLPDPNQKPAKPEKISMMSPSSEIKAESYSSFKPLPESSSGNAEEGMDELLARFGLGTKNNRGQKAISHAKPQNNINIESVPDNLKSVLKDLGLTYKDLESTKEKKKQHVFNPADSQYATQAEIKKLNKLVGTIKQLEKLNGSVSDEDLKHIDVDDLKQLLGSLNVPLDAQIGPNPVDYDTSIHKNEVKRQQSTTAASVSVVTEGKNPSLADLEDSFGGASDTASEAVDSTTEAPKRTGFYYLVDWNTFLDIDNQKGKRVNLRFQPTIGDPKRFISVNVP